MDSTAASAGTTLHATITIINRTAAPIVTYGCRNTIVAVSLVHGALRAAHHLTAGHCTKRFSIPIGTTTFPATVSTRYQPRLDPLPPGRYLATVELLTIELPEPPAIAITLTRAEPSVNRGQPARCNLDQHTVNHVDEDTVMIGGVRYYKFTNTGPTPCLITDAPDIQLFGLDGPLRTVTSIPNGGPGPSAPRQTITLQPRQPNYLNLFGLTRHGFGDHPPDRVCPTSTSLRMAFPYSPGSITITGPAGQWSTYEQLARNKLACGLIEILPLSMTPSDGVSI